MWNYHQVSKVLANFPIVCASSNFIFKGFQDGSVSMEVPIKKAGLRGIYRKFPEGIARLQRKPLAFLDGKRKRRIGIGITCMVTI